MSNHDNGRPATRGKWVFWGFAAVIAYFLWTEHRAHVLQYLPFLLLLACPIMHLFHHHGGQHNAGDGRTPAHRHDNEHPEAKP